MQQFKRIHIAEFNITTSAPAYAVNDFVGEQTLVPSTVRNQEANFGSILMSLVLIDQQEQNAELDIYFLKETDSGFLGDNNGANVSSTGLDKFLGHVHIDTADYIMLGSTTGMATKTDINLPLVAVDGATSVVMRIITREIKTWGGAPLRFRLGLDMA